MKAITLYQPWASLIRRRVKTIETRGWSTRHRGPVAIHVARRPMRDARACHGLAGCFCPGPDGLPGAPGVAPFEIAEACPVHGALASELAGMVVAVAELADVVPITERDRGPHVFGDRVVDVVGPGGSLWLCTSEENREIEDQRPYGDFTPGRYAWLLRDIEPLATPVAVRGMQGLWEWTP